MSYRITAGRVLFGIAVLLLSFDALIKVIAHPMAVKGTLQLGYPASTLVPIGDAALACLVLFIIPRTAPLFGFTLFPVYFAAIIWGSLYLRDPRVRQLVRAPR